MKMATEQALAPEESAPRGGAPAAEIGPLSLSGGGAATGCGQTATSPWILDRWRDLLLFVATPLLLIPIFAAA